LEKIAIDGLTIDPGIQLRARGVDSATVQGYVEALSSGAEFPPVMAFSENGNLWLADGFHRIAASRFCGLAEIDAEIQEGTRQDAKIHAALANVEHGKPMSQAQKREAGQRLLELTDWADREIARRLAVSHTTIQRWRESLSGTVVPDTRTVTRNGATYQMDVTNIGQQQQPRGELTAGPAGSYYQEGDLKECAKCGQLWMVDLPYCPYCNVSQGARVWHAEQEQKQAHVSHNSGNNEWYTPPEYIRAARQVMGSIDLDPASSEIANRSVGAATFYTVEDDGLQHDWQGRVWMNPPYASHLIGQFADKLAGHVQRGDVSEACVLVNNATETGWFNTLLDVASCACFIRGRVKFIDQWGNPSGAPLQGQVVLYIGPGAGAFERAFSGFGTVLYAGCD